MRLQLKIYNNNNYKDQDQVERVLRLRELLVMEWLGDYSHEYEMFLTIADKSSFYEMAQQFCTTWSF